MFQMLRSRFLRDRRGGVATVAALSLPVMIGSVGLAVDIGQWYQVRRSIHNDADAAAFAAALDLARQGLDGTASAASIEAAARDALARNGSAAALTVNFPPTSGAFAGDARAVEVITTEPAALFFARLFVDQPPAVAARAVGLAIISEACVWALDPSQQGALTVAGSTNVDLSCGVYVNSDHPQAALDQYGSSCLSASVMSVVGGAEGTCLDPQPETFMAPLDDPLADMPEPTWSGCDYPNRVEVGGSASVVLTPGVYCGGLKVSGEATFAPGEYIFAGGDIVIEGRGTVRNDENASGGVSFFLTGSGGNYANVSIAGGADVVLTPMTTGDRANVLFMQDDDAPSGGANYFTGGSSMTLEGLLYFPAQHLEFTGGSASSPSDVLVVGNTVTFTGDSYFNSNTAKSLLENEYYARLVE